MSQINIIWYVANVSFFSTTPARKFNLNKYTALAYLKYKLRNLLPHEDNRKIVKLNYYSPLIDNEWNIEFIKFEHKTDADVRTM